MASKKTWSVHEAVILLEEYLKVISNIKTRKHAISDASNKLRQMAQKGGLEIDDIFRNIAGITFQMASMESAYCGRTIMKPASKLFTEVVTLYRTDPEEYHRLLKVAYDMCTANNGNKDQFANWLTARVGTELLSDLYYAYQVIDEYAQRNQLISEPILHIADVTVVQKIQLAINQSKQIRSILPKNKLRLCNMALAIYIQFLDQRDSKAPSVPDVRSLNQTTILLPRDLAVGNTKQHIEMSCASSSVPPSNEPDDHILQVLDELHIPYLDYRSKKGCLWVIGDHHLKPVLEQFICYNVTFHYKVNGGRVTKGSSAWWTKDIISISGMQKSTYVGENTPEKVVLDTMETSNAKASPQEISDRFLQWMLQKGYADSTARGYLSALHTVSTFATNNNMENVYLFSHVYTENIKSIDVLLANKDFIQYNKHQFNRLSVALRKLRDFSVEMVRNSDQLTSDTALEMLYPVLYRKVYSISKVYDDPRGMTVDRILHLIGNVISKAELISFLDQISWASKLSDELYTFASGITILTQEAEPTHNTVAGPGSYLQDFDKDAFVAVLLQRFPNGMEFDSIDLEIFRDTYNDLYDETLTFSDEGLEQRLKVCGVIYKDRVFPADGIIDPATKERLFAYIENQLTSGNQVLYYKAIFSDLSDAFAYCFSLTDETMLKAYLEFVSDEGQYFFFDSYMSKEEKVEIDHSEEVVNFMLDAGKPISYEDIYAGLSHIDKDIIYREIHGSSKYVMNEREHYFHIDIFEFSQADGERIAAILNKEIDENGYAIWSKAFESIREQLPVFLENNLYLSSLGIRNALSQFMSDRFNFEGEVISTHGVRLSMGDVFRLYAKHHTPFTDNQIYEFSKEVGSPIYFWALAEESVRVSKSLFVAKDQIRFDVDAVDKAIETYLTSGYILIKEVDSFLVFPNVGYEWNEYLLESFLLHYSKKYTLVNNGISLNNVAGAIARKDAEFTQFVDVCAQALADSNVELKKAPALNYLAELNLITRRSYKDLESAMTKARRIRNRKG